MENTQMGAKSREGKKLLCLHPLGGTACKGMEGKITPRPTTDKGGKDGFLTSLGNRRETKRKKKQKGKETSKNDEHLKDLKT